MHFFSAILTGIFVALVIAFALTFGVAMLLALGLVALLMAILFYSQIWWRRWQIIRRGGTVHTTTIHEEVYTQQGDPQVIDVEYTDVTHKDQ